MYHVMQIYKYIMEATEKILVVTEKMLEQVILRILGDREKKDEFSDFDKDKLSKPEAAKMIGISIPTLDNLIKAKRFKQYNLGGRKYFLKSEILIALRQVTEDNLNKPYKSRIKPTTKSKNTTKNQ